MILSINVNAALDRIFFIDRFIPGAHMRTHSALSSVGGKGLTTSVVLQTLGAPVCAVSFIAGKNGETLAGLLDQRHIRHELIWVPGETRVSNVIVETDLNRHSHVTASGYSVTPDDCATFLAKIDALAESATWAVIAGSLPQGAPITFYRELIELLHQHRVRVLIDTAGPVVLETLPAAPDIVKMNQEEFQATFNVQASTLDEWLAVACQYKDRYAIPALVITCGKDGILMFTSDGIYQAGCAEIREVNAAGAGDAVSAALVYRFSQGESWIQALPWAVATSAAVVLTEGTAECNMDDVLHIYPQAWVKTLQSQHI